VWAKFPVLETLWGFAYIHFMKNLFLSVLAFLALLPMGAQAHRFVFPEGVGWQEATVEQVSGAVFATVKEDPEAAVSIVEEALRKAAATGRWAPDSLEDGREADTRDADGKVTFEGIAAVIVMAAKKGNPEKSAEIDLAVSKLLPGLLARLRSGGPNFGYFDPFGEALGNGGGGSPAGSGGGGMYSR
jgi:hypothetical protein